MIFILFLCCFLCCSLDQATSTSYVEKYFDQRIDHFNFYSFGNRTFKQRYIYNDTWWNPGKGPIFFYAGNEGNIVSFWENSGFMFDIAPEFQALVLFAEHRYYGTSLPFGNDSFVVPAISLLSIEQALADYAFLLTSLKKDFKAENCTVIAFGGSYGGILAAYMRFKYPNIIHGAIAASASLYQLAGKIPGEVFFQSITREFHNASPNCENLVRTAFAQLKKWADLGKTGFSKISRNFMLCDRLSSTDDFDHFLRWIRYAFVIAAMMDYPYPATFMGNFPAYPVNVMCDLLESSPNPVSGLYTATALFYNSTQTIACNDIYAQYIYCSDPTGCGLGSDSKAWDYQACTEVNLEDSTNGVTDMFPVLPFDSAMRDAYCLKTWKVLPRRDWLGVQFWGYDIASSSNIVFSYGDLDPWASGGVLHNISQTIVSVLVKGGAHHLDLRGSNPADPPSVIAARKFEADCIRQWLSS